MPLIEGVGDEVTQFFIALIVITIVTLAWWTTSISEQRHIRTVLLLDRRRHRNRAYRRLTNHTETVTITAGVPVLTTAPIEPETTTVATTSSPSSAPNKPQEEETSTNTNNDSENDDENEQNRIIESMDADTVLVRQRRINFYENSEGTSSDSERNEQIMEHNCGDTQTTNNSQPSNEHNIRIKLKYINDDLKLVDGKLEELLGDFKRRHFQPEISANKLVRLIFNGQVLQQDTETLQSCGLFDNCVVHCLIHQKMTRNTDSGGDASASNHYESVFNDRLDRMNSNTNNNNNNNNNNNHQPREWDFGNSLFACISVILLTAWYFRYVYAHLYTVTATVGLILITGIFTIVLVGMYFPDNENLPDPRIHIHTERVQSASTQ